MTQESISSMSTRWAALTAGLVFILAAILIVLFLTLGEPFGTLNDLANGIAGMLCGLLAWMLFTQHPLKPPLLGQLTVALAFIGALLVVTGTVLVVLRITGAVLAGWYTAVGNALIGIWLAVFSYSVLPTSALPRNLCVLGRVTGILMAVGLVALPAIVARTDSMESMAWYLNLAFLGVVGAYILFPVWAIWLGRNILQR